VKVTVKHHVPRSCCALNFNQDRELYWVDPQEIQLKDEVRCQEDAQGRIDNTANLNRMVSNTSDISLCLLLDQVLAVFVMYFLSN